MEKSQDSHAPEHSPSHLPLFLLRVSVSVRRYHAKYSNLSTYIPPDSSPVIRTPASPPGKSELGCGYDSQHGPHVLIPEAPLACARMALPEEAPRRVHLRADHV